MKKSACLVMALWAGVCLGQKTDVFSRVPKAEIGSVESSADQYEMDQKSGWLTMTGNVWIKTDNHEMTADNARLNRESGDVEASGNVVITQTGLGVWRGDSLDYNYKTGKGLTLGNVFQSGVFTLHAREMSRAEDGRYRAKGAAITTCTNAPGRWHWHIQGDASFKENESASIYHAVPHFLGIPFAYLPYWYRSLNGEYGLRLVPGYSSKWGAFVLGSYAFNLYEGERGTEGVKLDSITRFDYRTLRGVGAGEALRWDAKQLGRGELGFYHLWDERPTKGQKDANWMSEIPHNRYRVRLEHMADLTPRDQLIVRGMYVSDSQIQHDFFRRNNREESIPINLASLEHRENAWATGIMASGPLNDFYSGVSRLPEAWLNILPRSVFDTGLIYEGQTRGGYLERKPAFLDRARDVIFQHYPGPWADYETVRANTAHRVTYPFKLFDALSIVPRAGYQGSYYTSSFADDNTFRHTAEVGATASMRAVGDWGNGWRHIIEPYLDYSWQPTYWNAGRDGRLYMFDRTERAFEWQDRFGTDGVWLPYDWHGLRPGVRNVLQGQGASGQLRSFLEWDAYGVIQLESPDGEVRPDVAGDDQDLRLLGSKLLFHPSEQFTVRAVGEWDAENEKMAYIDLCAYYRMDEHFSVGGGYLVRDHDLYDFDKSPVEKWNRVENQVLYGGFVHDLNEQWTWSLYARYDTDDNSLDEVGGYLQFGLDCIIFQLRSAYMPSYTRVDGTERDSDYRVSFMMWLRAEGRKPREEWLSW